MSIGYGGVDIFLFLSGLGLYFSLSKGNVKLSQYYKKRFCRILPEFWLFLLITYIISLDFNLYSFCKLIYRATTIGYWIPHTPYSLWYISCILFLYAIFPIYFKLFNKHGLKIFLITITLGLVSIAAYACITVFFMDNTIRDNLLILTLARIPIFFIGAIFGYYIKHPTSINFSYKKVLVISLLFILSIASLGYFLQFCKAYLWTCALYFLPFIIITPVLCIILALIMEKLPQIISISFAKIGALSLELYIVHEYIYRELIPDLTNKCGKGLTVMIVIALSFAAAIVLYNINKFFLQKYFRKILNLS